MARSCAIGTLCHQSVEAPAITSSPPHPAGTCSRQGGAVGGDGDSLPPEPGSLAEEQGYLTVLASPSCFGFLMFVCLWLGTCAVHDLAI